MAGIPPPIAGDLTALDPANSEADAQTLAQVQQRYNELYQIASRVQQDDRLGNTLERLGMQLTTQAISASQQLSFSGKARDLLPFLADVEKHVFLATGKKNDEDLRRAVYQFTHLTVSDFITEIVEDQPNITWANLKERLIDRFGERLDPQTLLIRLRNYAQRPGQSIAVFAELIRKKAVEIYSDEINTQIAQRELVSILAKGLKNKTISKKILLEHPSNYRLAVETAIDTEEKEQRLSAHGLRHEPMEVSEVRGHDRRQESRYKHDSRNHGFKKKPRPVCYNCGSPDHFIADCKAPRKQRYLQGQGQGDKKLN